jgi:hypothetical protein
MLLGTGVGTAIRDLVVNGTTSVPLPGGLEQGVC